MTTKARSSRRRRPARVWTISFSRIMRTSVDVFLRQPALGIERGFAAHGGGGNGLLIHRIGHVSSRKNTLHIRQRSRWVLQYDKTLGINADLAIQESRVGS